MLNRCLMIMVSLVVVVATLGLSASAQVLNLAPLVGKTTFTPEETATLQQAIQADVRLVATSTRADEVRVARDRLVRLTQYPGATAEFKQLAARLTLAAVDQHMDLAREHRNRLALGITVARLQTPEAIPQLLKLLGDPFVSVRYWAAKGLTAEPVMQAIIRGGEGVPATRVVLTQVQKTLDAETDPVTVETLFGLLQAVSNDLATDILVEQAKKKAVAFDLSNVDSVNAMRRAVTALQAAFARELRTEPNGKEMIVTAIVQILVQTPPYGTSLELVEQINDTLSTLTGQKSDVAQAIKDYRDQTTFRDSKLVDLIWVEQLGWVERLKLNGKVQPLDWAPQKSVEVTRNMSRQ